MMTKVTRFLPYVLLIVIGFFFLTWKIGAYPLLWYDEGSRMNLGRTFAETGLYATYSTEGYQPFNAWVIANPLDVLFTAGTMVMFGKSAALVRLAIVPFSLVNMILIAWLSIRLFGHKSGWVAALTVFAAPPLMGSGFLLIGRQNLGDNSSLTMLIISLIFWFHAWDTRRMIWAWVGGIVLGIGLISNFQLMVWVFPATILIWLGRWLQNRNRSRGEGAFVLSALLVIILWYGTIFLLMTESARELNISTLIDSIYQQLFNGLGGKIVTRTSVLIFMTMVIISLVTIMDLFQIPWKQWLSNSYHWKLATLGVSVLLCAFWYFFFSIGWPRYAYAGWIFTLMLLGWFGFRVGTWVVKGISHNNQKIMNVIPGVMVAGLIVLIGLVYGIPLFKANGPIAAEQMAGYINNHIPSDAVIETTEMELFGISDHWEFHYPSYEYILYATKQIFYERKSPQVPYNAVENDPDFLITGPLSYWIGLYMNSDLLETEFRKVTEFPPYQIFERIR